MPGRLKEIIRLRAAKNDKLNEHKIRACINVIYVILIAYTPTTVNTMRNAK